MRVLITGGAGHIGKAATERLLRNGHDVRILDAAAGVEPGGAETIQGDILDYESLREHVRGCDAIIHLAALRNPFMAPGHKTFEVNVMGTFNVFEAAAAEGIRRVVQASSINALGAFYSTGDIEPRYFPIDEEHPRLTTDPYSFSKQMVEDIGAYYWRREGISSAALRFPGVYASGYAESEAYRQRREHTRELLDNLVSIPEADRLALLADVKKRVLDFRRERPFEFDPGRPPPMNNPLFEDPLFRVYAADRFNFWAFIDERDAAQALEKGVTAAYQGDHVLFINAAQNSLGYDSRTLIRLFFPDVEHFKSDLPGASALLSIERARALLGFEPDYPQ